MEKTSNLEHYFNNYIMKNFLRSTARYRPEVWSVNIGHEVRQETFVTTSCSAEQIHSTIKSKLTTTTRTLKNAVAVLHKVMKTKEMDRRNLNETGMIRKRLNREIMVKQAMILGHLTNFDKLRVVGPESSGYRRFQSNLTNALTALGNAKYRAHIIVKTSPSSLFEWVCVHRKICYNFLRLNAT